MREVTCVHRPRIGSEGVIPPLVILPSLWSEVHNAAEADWTQRGGYAFLYELKLVISL